MMNWTEIEMVMGVKQRGFGFVSGKGKPLFFSFLSSLNELLNTNSLLLFSFFLFLSRVVIPFLTSNESLISALRGIS